MQGRSCVSTSNANQTRVAAQIQNHPNEPSAP